GPGLTPRTDGSRRFRVDRDAPDIFIRLRGAGQRDGEHAVPEACLRLVALDPSRQANASLETAVAALRIAALLVLDLGSLLAAQRESTILDQDIDVLLVEARQFRGDADFGVVLVQFHLRPARRAAQASESGHAKAAKNVVEQPVYLTME